MKMSLTNPFSPRRTPGVEADNGLARLLRCQQCRRAGADLSRLDRRSSSWPAECAVGHPTIRKAVWLRQVGVDDMPNHAITPDADASPSLAPLPPGFAQGTCALHQLAYFAVAPKRYAESGRLGLRHFGSRFGTPTFGSGEAVFVEGDRLVYHQGGSEASSAVTTLRQACTFLGIPYRERWFDGFHDPLVPVGPDTVLAIDPSVSESLATWRSFSQGVLAETRQLGGPDEDVTELQLWPEHFDQAFEMGRSDRGRRASYGASPGDAEHREPYLYVAPWQRSERPEPYWNDPTFLGASLTYAQLLVAEDPAQLALEFLARGYRLLVGP